MKAVNLTPEDFPDMRLLRGFEGGAVYTAERGGRFYLITDEGTMADLLDEEDREGLTFGSVREFDTEAERRKYAVQRGWTRSPRNRR